MSKLRYTHVSSGVFRSQESVPLKLELQVGMRLHRSAGNQTWISTRAASTLNHGPISPAPIYFWILFVLCMCVCLNMCVLHLQAEVQVSQYGVEVKKQLVGARSFLPPCGLWGSTPLVNLDSKGLYPLSHLADLLAKLWWLYWYCVLVLCLGFLSCCWDKIHWRRTLKLKGLPDSQLQVTVRQRGRKLYQLVIP